MTKDKKAGIPKGTECSFCGHAYIFPCNGKRYDCGNAVWVRSEGKTDYYKLPRAEQKKIDKTGKIPDIITERVVGRIPSVDSKPNQLPKKGRVRIENTKPAKKKRVRL